MRVIYEMIIINPIGDRGWKEPFPTARFYHERARPLFRYQHNKAIRGRWGFLGRNWAEIFIWKGIQDFVWDLIDCKESPVYFWHVSLQWLTTPTYGFPDLVIHFGVVNNI